MKTRITKDGDTIIVVMEGNLDFGTHVPLREDLNKLIRHAKSDVTARKIVFDLKDLNFVGSSGISSFVQTLKEFNQSSPTKPLYFNVKSEFRKVIKAFDEEELFEFFDNEDRARKSFNQ